MCVIHYVELDCDGNKILFDFLNIGSFDFEKNTEIELIDIFAINNLFGLYSIEIIETKEQYKDGLDIRIDTEYLRKPIVKDECLCMRRVN